MNILLISANRERDPYPVFPIGLAFLAGPLRRAGHSLAAVDLCFASDPRAALAAALSEHTPQAVVVSLRNMDNVTWPASRSYLAGLAEIVQICRSQSTVIVGGSGFSLMPQEILRSVGADFGVVGEGEEVLLRLLERLEHKEPAVDLPGVLSAASPAYLPPQPVAAVGTPERLLFDVSRYHREGGMANVQTKRGCPFACTYCTYPLLEGRAVRLRQVDEIIAEIRELVEQCGVSYLYFVDDIFNYPPDFASRLCRAMSSARLPVNWSAFINPDFLDPGLLDDMIDAGCDAIEFGSDSGSPTVLRNLGKSFSVDKLRQASQLCRERGLDFAHYLLFGGPGETRATIMENFALMDELDPTAVIAMTGIRIFPQTPLYATAVADGIVDSDTDMLQPVFYIAPEVRNFLAELVTVEALKRTNWVVPGLEVNSSSAMLDAIRMFKVQGPLWKLVKKLSKSHHRPLGN